MEYAYVYASVPLETDCFREGCFAIKVKQDESVVDLQSIESSRGYFSITALQTHVYR